MRPPAPPAVPHRRRRLPALAAGALIAVLVAAIVAGESAALRAEAAHTSALAQYRDAEQSLLVRVTVLEGAAQSVAAPLVAARALLNSSAGQALDDAVRSELGAAIAATDATVGAIVDGAEEGRDALSAAGHPDGPARTPNDLGRAHITLSGAALVDPSRVTAAREELRLRVNATTAAVAAWHTEQARLAAEAAAAQAAAAAAAANAEARARAQAAAVASPSNPAGSAAASPGGTPARAPAASAAAPGPAVSGPSLPAAPASHNEFVWTTGFQAELDACKGSVNMTPSFGTGVIGEHWSCGGSSFPRTEGAVVVLSGAMSGTFRVGPVVAVLNQRVDRIEDVPQGYELLYQTCLDGDTTRMSFTQLVRAG